MTAHAPVWVVYFINALIAAAITMFGALLTAATCLHGHHALGQDATTLSPLAWKIAAVTGLIAGLKDFQSRMAGPPKNGK